MSMQVTLTISEQTYKKAQRLAQLTSREVSDVLTDTLTISLPDLEHSLDSDHALIDLPDETIIALSELQLNSEEDMRLSKLLDKRQADQLNESEKAELSRLMNLYQEGLLRKAEALTEAVKRGLREPLSP